MIDRRIQRRAPLGQTPLLCGQIAGFVSDIIHQPHEGVERHERVLLGLRQQEECIIKITARGMGNAMTLFV